QKHHRDREDDDEHGDRAPLSTRARGARTAPAPPGQQVTGQLAPGQHVTSRHMNGSSGATAVPLKRICAVNPSAANGLMSTPQLTVTVTSAPPAGSGPAAG